MQLLSKLKIILCINSIRRCAFWCCSSVSWSWRPNSNCFPVLIILISTYIPERMKIISWSRTNYVDALAAESRTRTTVWPKIKQGKLLVFVYYENWFSALKNWKMMIEFTNLMRRWCVKILNSVITTLATPHKGAPLEMCCTNEEDDSEIEATVEYVIKFTINGYKMIDKLYGSAALIWFSSRW